MLVPLNRVVLPASPDQLPLWVDGSAEVLAPDRLRVPAGARASFGGLLSGFPAAWWQHGTDLAEVVLQVVLEGDAAGVVRRSDADGRARDVQRLGPGRHEVALPLTGFDGGGWYWLDVTAGTADAVVAGMAWAAPATDRQDRASVVMTAFAHPDAALQVLRDLADPSTLPLLDEVLVVDQGASPLTGHPGFEGAAAGLGQRLRLLRQANHGAGGGVARGQIEALRAGRSRWVLVLDDDVVLGRETVPRALAFAARATRPVLVGGHMLDQDRPTVLHTAGEVVDPRRFLWRNAVDLQDHDLADRPLTATPALHRRADVDFNPWWCCLVPLDALRAAGLPMPLFIKWDDVEHGLRMAAAGYPTVTLPGVAVHHEGFDGKPDADGWQAYVHHRNRLVAGLLHSPRPYGGALLPESWRFTWRPLRRGRLDLVALRVAAMADLLSGPQHLVEDLLDVPARAGTVQRGPHSAVPLAAAATVRHAQLLLSWRRLRRDYRAALPGLVSPEGWAALLQVDAD